MKSATFVIPLLTTLAAFVLTGCAHHHAQSDSHKAVYVAPTGAEPAVEQPVPQEDAFGAPPGSRLNWIQGYWAFADWRWFWVPGHWEEHRPDNGVWVAGRWDRRDGQWVWRPGHWEKP